MSAARKPTRGRSAGSKPAAKKPAAKSTAAKKKTAARKPAAPKKAVKKTTAKKTTARKVPAKSTAAKKTAPKKTAAKKKTAAARPAARTSPVTKPGSKKPVSKKPLPKRTVSKAGGAPTRPPVAKPRPVRPAKFDKAQLQAIRKGLVEKKAELEQRAVEIDSDSFIGTQSDLTGEVGLDEDFADAGTATFERERDLSIRNNMFDLIDQMGRAIARIDEGTYGSCERCGRPIDAARLRELPHALLCLDCKRREERAR